MLKSKIHRARVTGADLHYDGSIAIDEALMDAADLLPNEQVQVLNLSNGARAETYVIRGRRNSGDVVLNGAIARTVHHSLLYLDGEGRRKNPYAGHRQGGWRQPASGKHRVILSY